MFFFPTILLASTTKNFSDLAEEEQMSQQKRQAF